MLFLENTSDTEVVKDYKRINGYYSKSITNIPLDKRKSTRKKIKLTKDENKKNVLDGFQLAYKVTANSVYGQMGAKTSPVFFKR